MLLQQTTLLRFAYREGGDEDDRGVLGKPLLDEVREADALRGHVQGRHVDPHAPQQLHIGRNAGAPLRPRGRPPRDRVAHLSQQSPSHTQQGSQKLRAGYTIQKLNGGGYDAHPTSPCPTSPCPAPPVRVLVCL